MCGQEKRFVSGLFVERVSPCLQIQAVQSVLPRLVCFCSLKVLLSFSNCANCVCSSLTPGFFFSTSPIEGNILIVIINSYIFGCSLARTNRQPHPLPASSTCSGIYTLKVTIAVLNNYLRHVQGGVRVGWSYYKHPLPEHVYNTYMRCWGSVKLQAGR